MNIMNLTSPRFTSAQSQVRRIADNLPNTGSSVMDAFGVRKPVDVSPKVKAYLTEWAEQLRRVESSGRGNTSCSTGRIADNIPDKGNVWDSFTIRKAVETSDDKNMLSTDFSKKYSPFVEYPDDYLAKMAERNRTGVGLHPDPNASRLGERKEIIKPISSDSLKKLEKKIFEKFGCTTGN